MSGAQEIVGRLGLHRAGAAWRGNCPACNYRNALSVTERDGKTFWWCASCQDGRAIAAILRGVGGPSPSAVSSATSVPARPPAAEKSRLARELWDRAIPANAGLADWYLRRRGLPGLSSSSTLRFLPSHRYRGGECWPVLLAAVVDASGRLVAVHRTYLARDSESKAPVESAKMTLGPVAGGAIRLDSAADHLVVGEGIETSASAGLMLGLPAWAAVTAGNLARTLVLPAQVRVVTIAADADPVGQRSADVAGRRWKAESRRVSIITPNRSGCDFNDMLRHEATHG